MSVLLLALLCIAFLALIFCAVLMVLEDAPYRDEEEELPRYPIHRRLG